MKILEVNNIDLIGRRFNGYDFANELNDENMQIEQTVIIKKSNSNKVHKLLSDELMPYFYKIKEFEENELSVHSILSITTPALLNSKEFKDADIIHFHMFHNTNLSLYSLLEISKSKKIIISLHDPWFLTGHCVHFHDCDKWKGGCKNCPHLDWFFPLKEDNAFELWKLKKKVFENLNIHIVFPSTWMQKLIKESSIMNSLTNLHLIPFGIDSNFFSNRIGKEVARKQFGIESTDFVLFFRSQKEFKGTEYILKALSEMQSERKISIITCGEKGLLRELEKQYNIIELGVVDSETLIYCYNSCDIFLMPSVGESFGMMAIEAMSCSKPVVIFNNTALPYVTHAPDCGYLVKNKDYRDLKKAINFFISHPKEIEKRGQLGRQIVLKEYALDKYYDNIISLYKEVAKRKMSKTKMINEKVDINSMINLKIKLNKLSKQLFNDSKAYDIMKFDIQSNYEYNEKIHYSNLEIQKEIAKYNEKLYLILCKHKTQSFVFKFKSKLKKVPFLKKMIVFYSETIKKKNTSGKHHK